MIRQPQVLIFDEATNNLDNMSEATVQTAIDEITRNRIVIIIGASRETCIFRGGKHVESCMGRKRPMGFRLTLVDDRVE